MLNLYDIAYGLGLALSSPVWLIRSKSRRKILAALSRRMGQADTRDPATPAIMIHAVSVGEINAARELIDRLRAARPGLHIIVSVTTNTGWKRAGQLFGNAPDVIVVRYPLDFSPAVNRFLDALRPSAVALLELEVWPNFIHHCVQRGVPVLLINGRVTPVSFRRYRSARPLLGRTFARLHQVCAQDVTYAERFVELGVPRGRVSVTGTMKFDTAQVAERIDGQGELAAALGLRPGVEKIWVCGSTGPGEERIVLDIHRRLLARFADLRLVIVPRKPERFDEVAGMIESCGLGLLRRSRLPDGKVRPPDSPAASPVILIDTMGELRKCYAWADVIFVGRSLVDLGDKQHGSDMIEPAALGKAVIVGPHTANFADAVGRFVEANAIRIVPDGAALEKSVMELLADPAAAGAMGRRARDVVVAQQGATNRHVRVILDALDQSMAEQTRLKKVPPPAR